MRKQTSWLILFALLALVAAAFFWPGEPWLWNKLLALHGAGRHLGR